MCLCVYLCVFASLYLLSRDIEEVSCNYKVPSTYIYLLVRFIFQVVGIPGTGYLLLEAIPGVSPLIRKAAFLTPRNTNPNITLVPVL